MMAREFEKVAHESRAVQGLGAARRARGRGRSLAQAGQGTASGFREGERSEFSRCPRHPEQVPVQARAALLAGERDRRRGQAGRRRRAPVPADIDFPVAASFGLVYATAYHALKDRAGIRAGETLLVLGAAGGVGPAAVELGKLLGARVIACASSEEKLETCKRFGAEVAINYEREDLREALKNLGRPIDIVLDPVGGKYSEPAVRAMAWKGRYLVVGFASGEI